MKALLVNFPIAKMHIKLSSLLGRVSSQVEKEKKAKLAKRKTRATEKVKGLSDKENVRKISGD